MPLSTVTTLSTQFLITNELYVRLIKINFISFSSLHFEQFFKCMIGKEYVGNVLQLNMRLRKLVCCAR